MVRVAVPLVSWAVPSAVDPVLNVTIPVGVPLPDAEETLAVNVTPVPASTCVLDAVSAAVVIT